MLLAVSVVRFVGLVDAIPDSNRAKCASCKDTVGAVDLAVMMNIDIAQRIETIRS